MTSEILATIFGFTSFGLLLVIWGMAIMLRDSWALNKKMLLDLIEVKREIEDLTDEVLAEKDGGEDE